MWVATSMYTPVKDSLAHIIPRKKAPIWVAIAIVKISLYISVYRKLLWRTVLPAGSIWRKVLVSGGHSEWNEDNNRRVEMKGGNERPGSIPTRYWGREWRWVALSIPGSERIRSTDLIISQPPAGNGQRRQEPSIVHRGQRRSGYTGRGYVHQWS